MQEMYEELYMELSNAAAQCYALAGRLRNAGLMRSDVADALASRGNLTAAVTLYERQTRLFLAEAWHQLAGLLLRKLARTQQVTAVCQNLPYLTLTAVACIHLRRPESARFARRARNVRQCSATNVAATCSPLAPFATPFVAFLAQRLSSPSLMGTCVALLSLPDQMQPADPAAVQRDFVEAAAYADASQPVPSLLRALSMTQSSETT